MLAIASFIAAFPTSHIMSEKPIFSVPVSRSGEQRGVRTGDNVSEFCPQSCESTGQRRKTNFYFFSLLPGVPEFPE
jgi:hypothetical protein